MNDSLCLKTLAIIPVYNDNGNILKVLGKFREKVVDEVCLVIDCGGEDDEKIREAAINVPIHIIRNSERRGVGHAIKQGIAYALENGYHVVVVLAGNNKDDPGEIPRLLEPILKDGCDYVQGSRFLAGGRQVRNPVFRRLFSRYYPFFWTLFTHIRCTDVTNGFRAYKLKLFEDSRINIWQNWLDSYQLEYYIHYKVLTLGYAIKEVPVSKVYSHNHRGGYSQISPFRDWWKIVGPLVYLKLGVKK